MLIMRRTQYVVLLIMPLVAPLIGSAIGQDLSSSEIQTQLQAAQQRSTDAQRQFVADLGKRGGTIRGTMHRTPLGATVLVPGDRPDLSVTVANGSDIPQVALNVPIIGSGSSTPDGGAILVQTNTLELQAAQSLKALRDELDPAQHVDLLGSIANLENRFRGIVQSGAMSPVDRKAFIETVPRTVEGLLDAYCRSDPADRKLRDSLVDKYSKALVLRERERRAEKAQYGRMDAYYPVTYRRIAAGSKGSAGLLLGGRDRPDCSGVLVGKDVVLTSGHCIRGLAPETLQIWFNYEQDPPGTSLNTEPFDVEVALAKGEPILEKSALPLDFALLKIIPNGNGKSAGDLFPIQCLGTYNLHREHPLYVVGHPLGNPRTIHDNAWVLFPYELPQSNDCTGEYWQIKMGVEIELRNDESRDSYMQLFENSYIPTKNELGHTVYYQFDQTRAGNGQPSIGTDSDTYHGNSGSATYDKQTHFAVGIFRGGQPDSSTYNAGWRRHESVVPMRPIVEQITRQLGKNWEKRLDVCIYTRHNPFKLISNDAAYQKGCAERCTWQGK
jgi:hypothetical protein